MSLGSGKAGRHVIPYLLAKGHKVLNLDLVPFPDQSADVYTLKTDLTDSGQVFNALTTHFNMSGYSSGPVPGPPDVVIHFAGESYRAESSALTIHRKQSIETVFF